MGALGPKLEQNTQITLKKSVENLYACQNRKVEVGMALQFISKYKIRLLEPKKKLLSQMSDSEYTFSLPEPSGPGHSVSCNDM